MKRDKLDLLIEPLEERIAPGAICDNGGHDDHVQGNNGWGNGEDAAPGNSLAHQPKFEDPNTGPTPSHSPASGGGDR